MDKIFKIGEIVQNYNGYQYEVIESKSNKTLFINLSNNEYVVGCYVKYYEDDNKIGWAWGHYYKDFFNALDYYLA